MAKPTPEKPTCHDALREVERHLAAGRHHILDVAIKGYFDNIPHQALMKLVKAHISDGKVLGIIKALLKRRVIENGIETSDKF